MDEKTEKIGRFFAVCDELVEGSYVNADSKISAALQIIATCRELAQQIEEVCRAVAARTRHVAVTVVGGVGYVPQKQALARGYEL